MKNLKKLTLLHSNDMHGDFLAENVDENLVGGLALLSGYINRAREDDENVIYTIAGDMFRGSSTTASPTCCSWKSARSSPSSTRTCTSRRTAPDSSSPTTSSRSTA